MGQPTRHTRTQKLSPDRRLAIVRAAMAEIADVGVEAASINQIAKRATVPKSLLYYYFADRDDVLAAVVDDMIVFAQRNVLAPLTPPIDAAQFWQALAALYRAMTTALDADPLRRQFVLRMLQSMRTQGDDASTQSPFMARPRAVMAGVLQQVIALGQQLGAVRSDVDQRLLLAMLFALIPTCHRWVLLSHDEKRDRATAIAEAVGILRGALAPPAATRATPKPAAANKRGKR